jgi:hypothetical protein
MANYESQGMQYHMARRRSYKNQNALESDTRLLPSIHAERLHSSRKAKEEWHFDNSVDVFLVLLKQTIAFV